MSHRFEPGAGHGQVVLVKTILTRSVAPSALSLPPADPGEELTVSGPATARTAISYTARAEDCVEKRDTAVNTQVPGTDTVLYAPFANANGFVVCEGTVAYGQMYPGGI
ncbi:hypothetical protein [Streptomyces lonarensis]|uniref:Uncharacterized protein n=1 Tax=Streptomyces lonarensis TaxID=700599 RepID=A0A7X6CXQ5_9ACTN|nr:hypothetical protein [Streptomyces lonarensis]NJQ04494.1 hypothetical protein [Streptomyces lonarensis]